MSFWICRKQLHLLEEMQYKINMSPVYKSPQRATKIWCRLTWVFRRFINPNQEVAGSPAVGMQRIKVPGQMGATKKNNEHQP